VAVERLARKRGVSLPGGDMFAETPVVKGKKPAGLAKKSEPPKPAAPTPGNSSTTALSGNWTTTASSLL